MRAWLPLAAAVLAAAPATAAPRALLTLRKAAPKALGRDEVPQLLETLASGDLAARVRAEGELAVSLRPEHVPLLARAVEAGDAEVRLRLSAALGRYDRHLAIGAQLLQEDGPQARALGVEVVQGLCLRWHAGALAPPLEPLEWPRSLRDGEGERLEVPATDLLRVDLDLLARRALGGVPVVVDPAFEEPVRAVRPRGRELEGTALELLVALCGRHSARPVLLGGEDGPRIFLALRTRGRVAESLAESAVDWLEAATRRFDPEANRRGASALARLGWPAALRWLEARAAEDAYALRALVEAAGAGQPLPGLTRDPLLPRVLALGDEAARALAAEPKGSQSAGSASRLRDAQATVEATVEACARALRSLAPAPTSPAGQRMLAGWEDLPEEARWMRLVGLAHGGSALLDAAAAAPVRARARAELEQVGLPSRRLAALALLAQLAPRAGEPATLDLGAGLAGALRALPAARRDACLATLAREGYAPDSSAAPELAFAWALAMGEPSRAPAVAAARLADAGPWSEEWQELARTYDAVPAPLRTEVASALGREAPGLASWLLAGDPGGAGDALVREALGRVRDGAAASIEDLGLLARSAANPVLGSRARQALLSQARDPEGAAEALPALRLAWDVLGRLGISDLVPEFERSAELALRQAGHPLGPGFARTLRESGREVRRLRDEEWRLDL